MIYFISDNNGFIKIGVAIDVDERMKTLQVGNAQKLKLLKAFKRSGFSYQNYSDLELERALHIYFKDYNVDQEKFSSEWFKEEPVLELLKYSDDEINDWFKRKLKFSDESYEEYIKIENRKFTQCDVDKLKKNIKKKNAEIKKLQEQIQVLQKNNNVLENQIDTLSRNFFRRVSDEKMGNS